MNMMLQPSAPRATVYTTLGHTLRVPLRPGRAPERQLIVWLNRQMAANPAFSVRVKSVLLVLPRPLCAACRSGLYQFLRRWNLAGKLRLIAARAPSGCSCSARGGSCRAAAATSLLDELLGELPGEAEAPPPLQLGSYATVRGHHVHQSAAYGPPAPVGQRQPPSARSNPNHRPAIAIRQNVPGFTGAQHQRASGVQNTTNRAAHGGTVDERFGRVRVRSGGTGRLAPTPTPWYEDVKAYYALLAAGRTPQDAYAAVRRSAQQLDASGTVPRRVPR